MFVRCATFSVCHGGGAHGGNNLVNKTNLAFVQFQLLKGYVTTRNRFLVSLLRMGILLITFCSKASADQMKVK